MNEFELKIRLAEKEVHTGLYTLHKNGTKTKKPDIIGYMVEDVILSDYMVWLHNTHIILRQWVFHIQNEGNRGGKEGARDGAISKGKGKKKGVLDVENIYLGNTCWIEFKDNDGIFSDEQLDFIAGVTSWGQDVFIVKGNLSFDWFKFIIEKVILKGINFGGGMWTIHDMLKLLDRINN